MKIFHKTFHLSMIIPTALMLLVIMAGYVLATAPDRSHGLAGTEIQLSLTHHTLWDNPALEDNQTDSLQNMILGSKDSAYLKEILKFNSSVKTSEVQKIGEDVYSMPDSPYKGYLQLFYLYNVQMTLSPEECTLEKMQDLLQKGIELSEGKYELPQGLFFLYWSNCLGLMANMDRNDLVTAECVRMLKLCRKKSLPLGLMYSYYELAAGLIVNKDFRNASDNLDKAVAIAEKYYPGFWGKDWNNTPDISYSYSYTIYRYFKSLNAAIHSYAKDTAWLRSHEKEMLEALGKEEDFSVAVYFYYSLANYYIETGQQEKYSGMIAQFEKAMKDHNYLDGAKNANTDMVFAYYGQTLLNYEIHAGHPDAAQKLADEYKDKMRLGSESIYIPDAYMLAGRYKEAAERYKHIIDTTRKQMNGRNSSIFQAMSASIDDEQKEMQLMETRLEAQHQRLVYVIILTLAAVIMVIGLAYFLIRQRKLNRELSIAVEAEKRANNIKNIFLKNINHEFRTPLNSVAGFSQIMSDPSIPLDEESARTMASSIKEGADRLTSLIDNIVKVTDRLSTFEDLEKMETILHDIEEEEAKAKPQK